MTERIISTVLFLIGGVVCYGAGKIAPLIFKEKVTDEKILNVKITGYIVVLIALFILFV
ncbi:MAG: hypothetical protein Q4G23_00270 [Clostridia bacterium]|nr:hypothetical protein [Clostridia bacterium]